MMQDRKVDAGAGGGAASAGTAGVRVLDADRPLTARSVVASVLLGMRTPELSGQRLVRTAELFGFSEGTTRVAMSRMVSAGELEAGEGRYRLAGPLLARQARQDASRRRRVRPWNGEWRMAVVAVPGARPAGERVELRRALSAQHLAEWREGVWVRPDNLEDIGVGLVSPAVASACTWFAARPVAAKTSAALAGALWDLEGWVGRAEALSQRMAASIGELEEGRTDALAPCFMTAAAVVRHIQADPMLPEELLPEGWPGTELRAAYDRYEAAYQRLLAEFLRGLQR